MFRRVSTSLLLTLPWLSWFAFAESNVVLLASDDDDPFVCPVDPFNGIQWSCGWYYRDWENTDFTVTGTKGMALHPTTRQLYVVLDTSEDFHRLIRFDPRTFSAYDIGNLGQLITGLAFDDAGTLYGVSSDTVSAGGMPATTDSIFTISVQTAATVKIADLPGPDGFDDTIAYNYDDGKLYHWGGYNTQSFNRLNLQTNTWEAVGVPASWPAGVGIKAFTYDGFNQRFLGFRQSEFSGGEEFFTITWPGNAQAALAAPPANTDYRGVAFVDGFTVFPDPNPPDSGRFLYGVDPNLNLLDEINPDTGEVIGETGLTLNGNDFDGFNGMATDPTNGDIYVVLRSNRNARTERQLAILDQDGLGASPVGITVEAVAGLAFSANGQLYGITGDGGTDPSTLFAINKDNATGSLLAAFADNGSGEAIAYNSRNGKMYRFSGFTEMQAISLDGFATTDFAYTGDAPPSTFIPASATYDEIENRFLVFGYDNDAAGLHKYYSVTPTGLVTTVLVDSPSRKGMAFSREVQTPLVAFQPADDVDNDTNSDIAVMFGGPSNFGNRNTVYVMDAGSGNQLGQVIFGPEEAKAYTTVPDMTDDGLREHAVLVQVPGAGNYFARVKNPADGSLLGKPSFDPNYEPFAMIAVGDIDGDLDQDLAVIGRQFDTGRVQVQVKRVAAETLVSRFNFDKNYAPIDALLIDNVGGDAAPEIAVVGVDLQGRVRAQIKDAQTGALVRLIYFDKTFDPLAAAALPDPNGDNTYIGVLGKNAAGIIRVQIKDASDGSLVGIVRFDSAYTPFAVLGFADSNSNGSGEVTVMGVDSLNRPRAQTKEIETGALVSNINFSSAYEPVDAIAVNSVAGTGRNEIALLAKEFAGIQHRLQVKDVVTGAPVGNIFVPPVEF